MSGPRTRDLIFLPGQLLGVAIPFLRFAGPFVPVRIPTSTLPKWPGVPLLLVGPIVLGAAMAASTVRQVLAGRLSRAERACAYVLAFVVLTTTACAFIDPSLGPALGPTAVLAAFGAIAILAATRKGPLPSHVHAHLALLSAWIVNMGFIVIAVFTESHRVGPGWGMGAVSVLAVTAEAIIRVRRALRSEGEAGAEARQP